MAQHDYNIANQTAPNARTDINNALNAIATNNSGGSAPSTTFASQWWYDTGANLLRIRNEANTGWITAAYLDGSTWKIIDNTPVVNTSGTQTGLLGDQATSTWNSGTGTIESLVSPAKVKSAIQSIAPALSFSNYSNAEQGYVTLSVGIKITWGYFTSVSDNTETHNFHSAFPNNCWNISVGGVKTTPSFGGGDFCPVRIVSRTQFQSNRNDSLNGTYRFYYIAIGN